MSVIQINTIEVELRHRSSIGMSCQNVRSTIEYNRSRINKLNTLFFIRTTFIRTATSDFKICRSHLGKYSGWREYYYIERQKRSSNAL